ncbi:MAG: foldase [Polyangiaceae bacterium]|nr:foldase [Polyangiaceae bacterium]
MRSRLVLAVALLGCGAAPTASEPEAASRSEAADPVVVALPKPAPAATGESPPRASAEPAASLEPAPEDPPSLRPEPRKTDPSTIYGARHIVVQWKGCTRSKQERTRPEAYARIRKALGALKAGADFKEVAAEYSDEPGAKNTGGYLGRFKRAGFDPDFISGVDALRVGQLSEIMETAFGFHVVVRTE